MWFNRTVFNLKIIMKWKGELRTRIEELAKSVNFPLYKLYVVEGFWNENFWKLKTFQN